MTRNYSDELISFLEDGDMSRAGIVLAKLCVQANLPSKYVAIVLDVSRMTVYSWFRGGYLRDKNQDLVKDLIDILENDLKEGVLPVTDIESAKVYLEEISGKSMTHPVLEKLGKKVELKETVKELTKDQQYKLAELCLSQDDKKQAFIWYKKAAEAGHIEAQYELGLIFSLDYTEIEDYIILLDEDDDCIEHAISWYEKAAAVGHIEAQYQLAVIYGSDSDYCDNDEALFWYKKAAEQGHVDALTALYEGENVSDDIEQIVIWKEEAAELGHIKAQYDLGEIYRDGFKEYGYCLIEPDSDEAEYWFREVANNICNEEDNSYVSQAEYELGNIYLNSYIKSLSITDFDVAVFWYSEALKKGNGNAHIGLGELYYARYKSTSSEDDFNRSIQWFIKAKDHNRLGEIYYERYKSALSDDDFNQTRYWFIKAKDHKRLGDIYYERYKSALSDDDFNQTRYWFIKTKDHKRLGDIYNKRYTITSSEEDFKQIIFWYTKANAQYELGELYSKRFNVSLLESDFKLAISYYKVVTLSNSYLSERASEKQLQLIRNQPFHFRQPD